MIPKSPNTNICIPLHAQQIAPPIPTPISPTKPLHRSQQIADLGILTAKPLTNNAPAHNTPSQVQHHTITQEAILACMNICSYITSRSLTPANTARCLFPIEILNAVLDMNTGKLLEMQHLLVNPKYKELWGKSYTTELGRLAQGIPGVSKGTDTIVFIAHNEISFTQLKGVTYGRVCINYRPKEDVPNRTRLTVSGNRVNFPGDCGTSTVDMVTVKLHLNSVISTKGAHYCTIDLKDFYLMTPMTDLEYMHMKIKDLSEDFIIMYNLANKATSNGFVYIKIQKEMYGLPQAGLLAQELFEQCLNTHGYCQSPITPGLWQHDYRPISFILCVDNFGIKYVGREHAKHLASILSKHYKYLHDWDGQWYLGMTINWDYTERAVHTSMLDYVPKALTRFQHTPLRIPQHQPYPHVKPTYGVKAQYTKNVDTSPPLDKKGKKYIQEGIGTFLYHPRCIDSTMLPALGSLTAQQANPTQNTKKIVHQLLDYTATHPNAIITYQTSNMVLEGHSNASYLSETNACSRAGRHFFMSNDEAIPSNNGAIFTILQIIKAIMSSAAEAKIAALYINCKEAILARHTLEYLGHKQPPTPMQTDNTTALGVVNNNVIKKSKLMDMKYHWLKCRINQRQFCHYWAAGKSNNGDYVTKHHAPIHHQATRSTFLTSLTILQKLQDRVQSQLSVERVF
jgi:hypothetical protein